MARRSLTLAFCLGFASLAFATAAPAETIITTQWDETKLSQDECLDHAEAAIRKAGFKPLRHTATTRHGTRGAYTAAVRCLLGKGIVFYIVSGPSNRTERYLDDIRDRF
jgi:hypothetical protein